MSKKAFTMIELVFVIVILGILASIAVPRLVATRTDADVTKLVVQMRDFITTVSALEMTNNNPIRNASGGNEIESYTLLAMAITGKDVSQALKEFQDTNQWVYCATPYIQKDTSGKYILKFIKQSPKDFCSALHAHPTAKEWMQNGVQLGGNSIFK